MNYSQKLKDPRWQSKRLEILQRDNFTCRDTGATDEELQVHHCWYAKGGPWETPSEYLLTLSASAHKYRQELESRAKKALGLIMAKTWVEPSSRYPSVLEGLVESMECAAQEDIPHCDTLNQSMVDDSAMDELKHFFYASCGFDKSKMHEALERANFLDSTRVLLGFEPKQYKEEGDK